MRLSIRRQTAARYRATPPRAGIPPASGQQIAYEPADLFRHRCTVHFFFFLIGAACAFGAGATGAGTVADRAAPRQII